MRSENVVLNHGCLFKLCDFPMPSPFAQQCLGVNLEDMILYCPVFKKMITAHRGVCFGCNGRVGTYDR